MFMGKPFKVSRSPFVETQSYQRPIILSSSTNSVDSSSMVGRAFPWLSKPTPKWGTAPPAKQTTNTSHPTFSSFSGDPLMSTEGKTYPFQKHLLPAIAPSNWWFGARGFGGFLGFFPTYPLQERGVRSNAQTTNLLMLT